MSTEKIILENKAAIKLKYYTRFADGEVSGMGKTIKDEEGNIQITDIALFDQECTGTHTEIDDESLAKFMHELNEKGESLKDWNLWWHTHADMSVFWSTTDDTCISNHSDAYEHLVSIVTNKAGDYKGRLDIFPKDNSPYKKTFTPVKYDLDVEYYVDSDKKEAVDKEVEELEEEKEEYEKALKEINSKISEKNESLLEDDGLKAECEEEVKEKVRERKVVTHTSHNGYTGGRHYGNREIKRLLSKKKESYYARNKESQAAFENMLDDIVWGYSVDWQDTFERGHESDVPDRYDNVEHCPECQNPIILCECSDAIEKWGEKVGMAPDELDDYYYNKYNQRLALDDYHDKFQDHCRLNKWQGNLLPIVNKHGKKT